ncbi:hypothetical protein C4D60_Mb02t12540 [Musa balbisiana]|uniref:Uncharacterized protein n=1 Tax=Musa balbisiana TaxID=52838 RepID=A0A4S8IA65_MUSBA|nr:hypothetical protein C4D60_Mb02t12540 [Musa balbisiana]
MAKKGTWLSALAKPGNGVISFHDDKFNWKLRRVRSLSHSFSTMFHLISSKGGIAAAVEGTKMAYVPAPLAVVVKAMKLLSWMFKCLEQSHVLQEGMSYTLFAGTVSVSWLQVSSHRRVDEAKQANLGFELWKASSFSRKLLL